jgi:hypothetical protein
MIAIQEEVPLTPCGIDTFQWSLTNRRPCALVWGDPIDLSGLPKNGRGYKEGARIVDEAILGLWRQAAEAVVAGLPETLPDGARQRGPIGPGDVAPDSGASWPDEPWAQGPLGPVFPGRG